MSLAAAVASAGRVLPPKRENSLPNWEMRTPPVPHPEQSRSRSSKRREGPSRFDQNPLLPPRVLPTRKHASFPAEPDKRISFRRAKTRNGRPRSQLRDQSNSQNLRRKS